MDWVTVILVFIAVVTAIIIAIVLTTICTHIIKPKIIEGYKQRIKEIELASRDAVDELADAVAERFSWQRRNAVSTNEIWQDHDYKIFTFGTGEELILWYDWPSSYRFLNLVEKRCGKEGKNVIWFVDDNFFRCGVSHPLRIALTEFQADVLDMDSLPTCPQLENVLWAKSNPDTQTNENSKLTIFVLSEDKKLEFLTRIGKKIASCNFATVIIQLNHGYEMENKSEFVSMVRLLRTLGKEVHIAPGDWSVNQDKKVAKDFVEFIEQLKGVFNE